MEAEMIIAASTASETVALAGTCRAWDVMLSKPILWRQFLYGPSAMLVRRILEDGSLLEGQIDPIKFRRMVTALCGKGWLARYMAMKCDLQASFRRHEERMAAEAKAAEWQRLRAAFAMETEVLQPRRQTALTEFFGSRGGRVQSSMCLDDDMIVSWSHAAASASAKLAERTAGQSKRKRQLVVRESTEKLPEPSSRRAGPSPRCGGLSACQQERDLANVIVVD